MTASVVDAVRCAVEVQRAMVDRNAALPEDQRMSFRIGVNLGDIVNDGEDEFQGYFVRRNVRVGLRTGGGHEGELDRRIDFTVVPCPTPPGRNRSRVS